MSENQLPFGPDTDFPILVDPVLLPALQDATDVQRQLDTYPNAPRSYRDELEAELNGGWPRMDHTAYVTGALTIPEAEIDENGYDEETGMVIVDLDEEPDMSSIMSVVASGDSYVSQGFKIVEDGRVTFGEEDMGAHYAVKLLFSREVTLHVPELELPYSTEVEYVGDLDQVVVNFEYMSDELAELTAREYFEEYIDLLDERLDSCKTVAEGILALRGIDVYYEQYVTQEEQEALRRHVQEMLGLDYESESFHIEFDESTMLFAPDEIMTPDKSANANIRRHEHIRVCGIEVQPKVQVERLPSGGAELRVIEHYFQVRLVFRLLSRNAKDDSDPISIRLDDIRSLNSVRDVLQDAFDRQAVNEESAD